MVYSVHRNGILYLLVIQFIVAATVVVAARAAGAADTDAVHLFGPLLVDVIVVVAAAAAVLVFHQEFTLMVTLAMSCTATG